MKSKYKDIMKKYDSHKTNNWVKSLNKDELETMAKSSLGWRSISIIFGIYLVLAIFVLIVMATGLTQCASESCDMTNHNQVISVLEQEICDGINETHYGGHILNIDRVYTVVCEDTDIHLKL